LGWRRVKPAQHRPRRAIAVSPCYEPGQQACAPPDSSYKPVRYPVRALGPMPCTMPPWGLALDVSGVDDDSPAKSFTKP